MEKNIHEVGVYEDVMRCVPWVARPCKRHTRTPPLRHTMGDKPKQVKAFRVQGGSEYLLEAENFFERLHNAEHPVKRKNRGPLQLQHVFSRSGGSNTFLIYLIDKATPNFVEAVVKDALGPGYSTTCIHDRTRNESFLPVERQTKDTKISTIEREAAAMAEGSSAAFILVNARQKVVYSYNDQGLLLKGNPEPRGARFNFGSATGTPQVRSIPLKEVIIHMR